MQYRYRTTTALFPLVSPPPHPVDPHRAVIRRFTAGAVIVAIILFMLIFIALASLSVGMPEPDATFCALIFASACAIPIFVCGIMLAQLQCHRNLRGLAVAAIAGAITWCGIIFFSSSTFHLYDLYPSRQIHRQFTIASSSRWSVARHYGLPNFGAYSWKKPRKNLSSSPLSALFY